jgi:hypothetical protein
VRRLLLGLYPSSWRARYGDEFEALLDERPLGPFDVADILLAAVDAHLNLRGLTAADHARGFAMTLRIGGLAAVLGGLLWATGLIWASNDHTTQGISPGAFVFLAGTILLLIALVGLSAFQSRAHPRLVWAAFIVPALGAVVSVAGTLFMAVSEDRPVVGGLSGWELWFTGLITLVVGSGLFALASWRTGSVSRLGSTLLGSAAVLLLVFLPVSIGLVPIPWEPLVPIATLAMLLAFAGGWIVLGIGAIQRDRAATLIATGGAS